METVRKIVNGCIRIGLKHNASTMKRLSKLCYHKLARFDIISYYTACDIKGYSDAEKQKAID
jgi:hypothetical protein